MFLVKKKLKIKHDFKGSISNVDLDQFLFSFVTFWFC